jgi:hypothetical protein
MNTNELAQKVRDRDYYGVPGEIAEKYIKTLQDHIKYVAKAGYKLDVPEELILIHDNSKWSETEFPGYAMHFQGGGAPDLFSKAWLNHIHKNPHHWQHWIFPDSYTPKGSKVENGIVEMPYHYVLEMIADWMGASKAYTGIEDMTDWLINNLPKIRVHSKTDEALRKTLDFLGYADIVWVE